MFISHDVHGQEKFLNQSSVVGKFKSPKQENNKFTAEVITLNADATFNYAISTEFIKIKANGYWRVLTDSLLLNSSNKKEKAVVKEKRHRGAKLKFDVTYDNNEPLYYQLYLITSKDTLHIEDVFGDTTMSSIPLKAFFVLDARGFRYPTYFLKRGESNCFRITLERDRIFDNEVWRIKDGGDKLQPKGLNGDFMNYYLIRPQE